MSKKTKKILLITAVALLVVVAAVIAVTSFGQFQPKGINLIQNGDFDQVSEHGLPSEWYTEAYVGGGSYNVIAQGYGGGNCAQIISDDYDDARFVQKVAVNPNALYRLSAWVKTENVVAKSGVEVDKGCANIAVLEMFNISQTVSGNSDWTKIDFYGKTGAGQRSIAVALRLGFYGGDSKGTAYFDKVELVQMDELPEGVTAVSWEKTLNSGGDSRPAGDVQALEGKFMGLALLFMLAVAIVFMLGYRMNTPYLRDKRWLWIILFIGLLIRIYKATTVRGFCTDIGCFSSWATTMAEQGTNFYSVAGCDYPPLYMMWLGIIGFISKTLNIPLYTLDSPEGLLLLKSLPIACDLILGWFIYQIASKKLGTRAGICLAGVYVLNPVTIINSASWGQVDSVFVLFLVLAVYYFIKRRYAVGVFSYLAALLIKPQALIFAPIMLFGAIKGMTECAEDLRQPEKKDVAKRRILEFVGSVGTSIVIFILLSVIFMPKGKNIFWLVEHYFSTMGSYPYGTLSAFNFFGAIGGQWAPIKDSNLFGISYSVIHTIMMAISIVIPTLLYWVKRVKNKKGTSFVLQPKNRSLFLVGAVIAAAFATLPAMVHERYLFPALALLLMAFVVYGDKRLIYAFGGMSAVHYLNVALVLYVYGGKAYTGNESQAYMTSDNVFLCIGSVLMCMLFVYLVYVAFSIRNGNIKPFDIQPEGSGKDFFKPMILTDENSDGTLSAQVEPAQEEMPEGDAEQEDCQMDAPCEDSQEPSPCPCAQGRRVNSFAELKIIKTLESKRQHDMFAVGKKKKRFDLKDLLIIGVITVIYAVFAFTNLGATDQTPSSYWETETAQEEVVIDFGDSYDVKRLYLNPGIQEKVVADNTVTFYWSQDGENWTHLTSMKFNAYTELFKWYPKSVNVNARFIKVVSGLEQPHMRINEVVFFQSADEDIMVPIQSVQGQTGEHGAACLVDEQKTAEVRTYMGNMYFDEVYHARTAYEHLNNWNVYEWTHPPLGKVIISAGISLFGMNGFGWRFFGALTGVLMLPAMYVLGKLLFKKRVWATALTLLMALDGMHYVQTRISTVDSYPVFFIILMFLCMYKYFTMSFYEDKLWKTFIPLGLSGIFFGLGASTKWICLYAGVGLAIIFFISLGKRIAEYFRAVDALKTPEKYTEQELEYLRHIRNTCMRNVILTILFCVLFFVIIPVIIYCLSYIPYFNTPANAGKKWYDVILENQAAMFNYHSGLSDSHSFRSPWYEWPVLARPMWFYSGVEQTSDGMMECISCCGNPLIWWTGLVCTAASITILIKKTVAKYRVTSPQMLVRRSKEINMLLFVSIGLACNYLAWVLVPRSTFIYHYFASLPFIMIFTVYIFKKIYECVKEKDRKKVMIGIIAFFIIALLLFIMFYPILTGIPVSRAYSDNFLRWLPSWFFHG